MTKTILIGGYGPGVSSGMALKFGAAGFTCALVARNADKLHTAVKQLEQKGVKAAALPCDLSDAAAVKDVVDKARKLGPLTIVNWNAFLGVAGDLMTASAADLKLAIDVKVTGLVAAVQAAHADLKSNAKESAVLISNGAFGFFEQQVDQICVQYNAMGLGLANAAQHKLAGMLHEKLKADGIYVGELMIGSSIKGTMFDRNDGSPVLDPNELAAKLFGMYQERKERSVTIR